MPITVSCSCGKVFKVKDEFAGKEVTCQVCGGKVMAAAAVAVATADPVPIPSAAPGIPGIASAQQNIRCPACAEQIPAQSKQCPICKERITGPLGGVKVACPACAEQIDSKAKKCPFCGEMLTGARLSDEECQGLIQQTIASIDAYQADENALQADRTLRGRAYAIRTMVGATISGFGIVLIVAGTQMRDGSGAVAIGIILLLIAGICTIVSFVNDTNAQKIQVSGSAEQALKRYLHSIRTKRATWAYCALAPSARNSGAAEGVTFTNKSIPASGGRFSIKDLSSFKAYWKSIFSSPSGSNRSVVIKSVRISKRPDDDGVAVAEADLEFTSYPAWIFVGILLSLWIVVILYLVTRQVEKKTIRKTLIQRKNHWFIAESQMQGPLDKANRR